MSRLARPLARLLAVLLLGGCQDPRSTSPVDARPERDVAPVDAALDRSSASDAPTDQQLAPDQLVLPDLGPLGDDFALVIPAGGEACALGRPYATDLQRTFARVAQLGLRPTALRLPREGTMPTVELADTLEVGLERRQATSQGPGTITHSVHGTAEDGHHSYVYQQAFDLEGSTITLWWQIAFFIEGGLPVAQTRTVTDAALFEGTFAIELRPGNGDPPLSLGACKLPPLDCHTSRFTLDGQDTLTVQICGYCPPSWLCNSSPTLMARARFVSGGTQRDLLDPLRLAHASRQHNWGDQMAIVLDQPVGDVHGIYLASDLYPDHMNYSSATYLDASLQTLRTVSASNPQPATF